MRLLLFLLVAACASKAPVRKAEPVRPEVVTPAPGKLLLTPDLVVSTIRGQYMGGLQRCYRRHLKRDASASGRVVLSFMVDTDGRTVEGDASGIAEPVGECIEAQVARWRFPAPKQGDDARFALQLQLNAQ